MFTGIVSHCGTIESIEKGPTAARFKLQTKFTDIIEGESISVDGVCLTAISPTNGSFFCDVSPETLSVTAFGRYSANATVNLERALRPMDRLGGHWVTGHVDQTANVKEMDFQGDFVRILFGGIPSLSMRYVLKKGSIAINGVSLTINEIWEEGFEVMLIPHTLDLTNLSHLAPQRNVNIEFDWMIKVVLQQAERLKLLTSPSVKEPV